MTSSPGGPPRHRRGKPLRASWEPVGREAGPGRSGGLATASRAPERPPAAPRPNYRRRRSVAGLAVVLAVLTVVVVIRATNEPTAPGAAPAAPGVASSSSPVVGEGSDRGGDVNIPTAELPGGGVFPVSGAGSWHVVPGATPQVGQGRVYTYTVEVENGTTVTEGDEAFATAVDATLDDPRSWVGSGQIALRRIDASVPVAPDFRVSLTSQLTTRAVCGYTIRYEASCWNPERGRVTINAARWVRGAGAFEGQLGLYRQYAINHEVGHVFRNPHVPCPQAGALAPVMMQQSFGVSDDYLAQLTEDNPQGLQIPHDGKVCRANAWPFPER